MKLTHELQLAWDSFLDGQAEVTHWVVAGKAERTREPDANLDYMAINEKASADRPPWPNGEPTEAVASTPARLQAYREWRERAMRAVARAVEQDIPAIDRARMAVATLSLLMFDTKPDEPPRT